MAKPAAVILLSSVLFFANAAVVFASAQPLKAEFCPNPSPAEIDPNTSQPKITKVPFSTPPDEADKIFKRISSCPSACYDLTSSLSIAVEKLKPVLIVTTNASNQCKPENKENPSAEGRGCPPEKNEPRIVIVAEENKAVGLKEKIIGPKSRCNDELLGLVNSAFEKMTKYDTSGLSEDLKKLGDLKDAPPRLEGSLNGNQTLVDALSTTIGRENAEQAVKENPTLAAQLNEAIKSGDEVEARKIAEELKLNTNLTNDVARLPSSGEGVGKDTAGTLGNPVSRSMNTFGPGIDPADLDRAKQAISGIESGGRYDAIGPKTKSGDHAYGKYQIMGRNIPSWTREALGQALTPQQFVSSPEAQESVFEYKFSQFVQKYGGYENAAKVWFGGTGALRNAGASDILGTTVGRYAQLFNMSFNNAIPFAGTASVHRQGTSPFANMSPFFNSAIPVGATTQGTLGSSITQFFSSLFNRPSSNVSSNGQTTLPVNQGTGQYPQEQPSSPIYPTQVQPSQQSPLQALRRALLPIGTGTQISAPPVQAVANMIAEPAQIVRGKSFVVSWSSVGMSVSAPCNMLLQKGTTTPSVIAQGNEGSKTIMTNPAVESGTWKLTLQCTAYTDGRSVEETVSVLVQ